jgi:uncharacterized protein
MLDSLLTKKEGLSQANHLNYELISKKINSILILDNNIEAAYLLGSMVSGRLHPQSDIDLAILPITPKSFSTIDRLSLSARLQDELSYEIDIGIMGTHDLIYAAQAILHGHCIFFRDRFRKDLFAATCLALYVELKRQRNEVEHAYRT